MSNQNIFKANEHFAMNPVSVDLKRSTFDRSNTNKLTFDSGLLVPIFMEEVLPGDTFNIKYSYVIRMTTPLFPVMDTANLDVYFFFVPTRIVWDDFQKFMGENDNPWTTDQQEITVPRIIRTNNLTSNSYADGTLADYLGIPINKPLLSETEGINALPFRAYAKIWNDWFRDQNTQRTIYYSTGSADSDYKNVISTNETDSFYTNVQYGRDCAPVNKYQDYFTSCLPSPQKGDPVRLPLTGNPDIILKTTYSDMDPNLKLKFNRNFFKYDGGIFEGPQQSQNYFYPLVMNNPGDVRIRQESSDTGAIYNVDIDHLKMPKMVADMSTVTAATINELRQAFQVQRLLEKDARGGTRYIEIIRSHFGVISPDARLQRSEYLGGNRQPINLEQVLQTSSTNSTSPLGQTGAFSLTSSKNDGFIKSFTEHGYIFGVCCVRVMHTYSYGLSRTWTRFRKYDYYWPTLANIGEQPIFKREIYHSGYGQSTNNDVFGYNEAWADYRYKLNEVHGKFRPNATGTLKSWTYTDTYNNAPTLNNQWMRENKSNVAQTLAIQNQPQFIADFYFKNIATRPMPVYSIPGLLDHN